MIWKQQMAVIGDGRNTRKFPGACWSVSVFGMWETKSKRKRKEDSGLGWEKQDQEGKEKEEITVENDCPVASHGKNIKERGGIAYY